MRGTGPMPTLIGSVLVVAVLCAFLVKGGWLVWIPTLLAIFVVGGIFWSPRS
jgi:hypothetical protein